MFRRELKYITKFRSSLSCSKRADFLNAGITLHLTSKLSKIFRETEILFAFDYFYVRFDESIEEITDGYEMSDSKAQLHFLRAKLHPKAASALKAHFDRRLVDLHGENRSIIEL